MAGLFDDILASAPPPDSNEKWLEGEALAAYREAKGHLSPAGSAVLATSGGLLEGIPVAGPAIRGGVNRAAAALGSLVYGSDYGANLDKIDKATLRAKREHPVLDTGSQIAGGILATIPMVEAAPALFGAGNGSLATRSALSGVTGSVMGGADAAVRSGGDVRSTMFGAGAGGALGVASPVVGQLAGRGVEILTDMYNQARTPVPGVSGPASRMLTDDFRAAGGRPAIDARLNDLGPDAMLLDASPSFLGRAQGLAVRPETREVITDAVRARNAGTNARLATDVDAAFGPAPIPSQIRAGIEAGQDALQPEYGRVLSGASPVNPASLAANLERTAVVERGPGQRAATQVRQMLNSVDTPGALDNNPATLLNTRQAIDGLLATESDPNTVRILTHARQSVDAELAANVPGIKTVDGQYQELARQAGGLQRGSQVLDGGKTAIRPQEMAQELVDAAQPAGTLVGPSATPLRMRQGARAEIDRLVGTQANDLLALRQAVKGEGDWNRAKLAQLFGDEEANRVFGALDREAAFRDAYNKLVENSQTAMREGSARGVAIRGEVPGGSDAGGIALAGAAGGPGGAALAVGAKGAKAAKTVIDREADIARNRELARILALPEGAERSIILTALSRRAALAGAGQRAGETADSVVRALLQSQGARTGEEAQRFIRKR